MDPVRKHLRIRELSIIRFVCCCPNQFYNNGKFETRTKSVKRLIYKKS